MLIRSISMRALPLLTIALLVLVTASIASASGPSEFELNGLRRAASALGPFGARPLWSKAIDSQDIDILEFIGEDRVLVGAVEIRSGLVQSAVTGPVFLIDAETGRKLWSQARTPLPAGQYMVAAVDPVILLIGAQAESTVFTALDPMSGGVRWHVAFRAPYAAVPSPDGAHLIVTSGGWGGRKLAAVRLVDGHVVWQHSLQRTTAPKARPPLLAAVEDLVLVASAELIALNPASGEELWRAPSPLADEAAVSVSAWEDGVLLRGATRVALLDAGTGRHRWSRAVDGGEIRTVVPAEGRALVWTRVVSDGGRAVRDRVHALGRDDGSSLWQTEAGGEIRSPLLLAGDRFFYTVESAVVARDLTDGREAFKTEVPAPFDWQRRSEGFLYFLPDNLELRDERVVVARENFGVLAVARGSGELVFSHSIDLDSGFKFLFSTRSSNLFGTFWSGHQRDMKAAEKRYAGAMAGLLEGTVAVAQERANAGARASAAAAHSTGAAPAGSSPRDESEATRREIAAYDRAIAAKIELGAGPGHAEYDGLVAARSLARETLRQESQARVAVMGAERSLISVRASMSSMMATIELCNSVMSFMDGISSAIAEAKGLLKFIDLRHALELHRRSIDGRYFIRPIANRDARGMLVVDLETGARAEALFGVMGGVAIDHGIDLQMAATAPDGHSIVTWAIGLDPSAYTTYKFGGSLLPYASLLAFDAERLFRLPRIKDYDFFRAVRSGDVESVRALLNAGVDVNVEENRASVLYVAVIAGQPDVVRLLLPQGATVRVHGAEPAADALARDAALVRGYCGDDACRSRFDEALSLVLGARPGP